ncbi:MAG TPA: hypothetical protein VM865_07725 [Acidobacteriaceae bacterium]|jgi:hypothetical protein|nr:hypothetical protein [Acidobacteriaceae bacterium]
MKGGSSFVSALILAGLVGVPSGVSRAQAIQWNVQPPGYYNDVGRNAFNQGMEAARRDWESHRNMDPYRSPMYRRPPVAGPEREHFRDAFLRGYDTAVHHNRGWGYHDGNTWQGDRDHDGAWRNGDRDPR